MRGFGSWTQTKGVEELDYDQTIADIANLAEIIRNEFPGLKIFLLGESMGGAIALSRVLKNIVCSGKAPFQDFVKSSRQS